MEKRKCRQKKTTRNTIASLETRLGGDAQLRLEDGANDDRRHDQASTKLGTQRPKMDKTIKVIIGKPEQCTWARGEVDLKSIRLLSHDSYFMHKNLGS